jgi:hypothetical protein
VTVRVGRGHGRRASRAAAAAAADAAGAVGRGRAATRVPHHLPEALVHRGRLGPVRTHDARDQPAQERRLLDEVLVAQHRVLARGGALAGVVVFVRDGGVHGVTVRVVRCCARARRGLDRSRARRNVCRVVV